MVPVDEPLQEVEHDEPEGDKREDEALINQLHRLGEQIEQGSPQDRSSGEGNQEEQDPVELVLGQGQSEYPTQREQANHEDRQERGQLRGHHKISLKTGTSKYNANDP
jgi:hypothetical protein